MKNFKIPGILGICVLAIVGAMALAMRSGEVSPWTEIDPSQAAVVPEVEALLGLQGYAWSVLQHAESGTFLLQTFGPGDADAEPSRFVFAHDRFREVNLCDWDENAFVGVAPSDFFGDLAVYFVRSPSSDDEPLVVYLDNAELRAEPPMVSNPEHWCGMTFEGLVERAP